MEPDGDHAGVRDEQSLRKNTKNNSADQDHRVALDIATDSDDQLQNTNSACHEHQTESHSQLITHVADEEESNDIGKGVQTVEELELSLADA